MPAPVGRVTCRRPYPVSWPARGGSPTRSEYRLKDRPRERRATECSAAARVVEGLIYRRNQTTSSPPLGWHPACRGKVFWGDGCWAAGIGCWVLGCRRRVVFRVGGARIVKRNETS